MTPDASETVYDGDFVQVTLERWGDSEREIVEHAPAVAIVAVDREGRVVLVRQRREAVRRKLLELPAGIVDDGEEPLGAGRRELSEETGLHGGRWRELQGIYSSPGYARERITLVLAEELDEGEPHQDDGEQVEVVRLSRAEVERLLPELEDAKTLAGLLLWLRNSAKSGSS